MKINLLNMLPTKTFTKTIIGKPGKVLVEIEKRKGEKVVKLVPAPSLELFHAELDALKK